MIDQLAVLESIALRVWQQSYALEPENDDLAWSVAAQIPGLEDSDAWIGRVVWFAKWLHSGHVTLQTSHKYAAAMMATSVSPTIAEDIQLPWKAFSVVLPSGLFDGHGIEYSRIEVGVFSPPVPCVFRLVGERPGIGMCHSISLSGDAAGMLFPEETVLDEPREVILDLEFKERVQELGRRLVVGLLYTMQHTNNWKSMGSNSKRGARDPRQAPAHRNYFIGSAVGIDARPAVRTYLEGTRKAPPSVQSLVRGHYKRQVIGVGRGGRKVIWVEPYWRGPEEAPILSRPYMVAR